MKVVFIWCLLVAYSGVLFGQSAEQDMCVYKPNSFTLLNLKRPIVISHTPSPIDVPPCLPNVIRRIAPYYYFSPNLEVKKQHKTTILVKIPKVSENTHFSICNLSNDKLFSLPIGKNVVDITIDLSILMSGTYLVVVENSVNRWVENLTID